MSIKLFLSHFVVTFALAAIISLVVSLLYSLVVHGVGVFDWGISIRLGIVLGLIVPYWNMRNRVC